MAKARRQKSHGLRGLAGNDDFHAVSAKHALRNTRNFLSRVESAGKSNDCRIVWDMLMASMSAWASASTHLDSVPGKHADLRRDLMDTHARMTHLESTLGFQCTRKRGGV